MFASDASQITGKQGKHMVRAFFDTMPVIATFCITLLTVLLAIEAGFQIGLYLNRRRGAEREAPLGAMTGAHLALLAFIMAFSFNMAASHYDARKTLVLEEANALGTAYLRAALVRKPEGQEIMRLLRDYTAVRASVVRGEQAIAEIIEQSEVLHIDMWRILQQLAREGESGELEALLVTSINELIDLHSQRTSAYMRKRIPPVIWGVLTVLLIASMVGMGYFTSLNGKRNPVATTGVAISFSVVMFLIVDLDRPASGLVRADQSAILELDSRLRGISTPRE